jgi:hypothetical protein
VPAQIQKVPATGARVGSRILVVMPTHVVISQNIVGEHFILGHPVHFVN